MGSYLSTYGGDAATNEKTMTPDEIYAMHVQAINEYFGVDNEDGEDGNAADTSEQSQTSNEHELILKSVHVQYFDLHREYSSKFRREKMIIVMQVGSFYEMYQTDTEGPDLVEICRITDLIPAKLKHCPDLKLLGFPVKCLPKYKDLLTAEKYNVVVVSQFGTPPNTRREVQSIYGPRSMKSKDVIAIRTSGRTKKHLRNVFIKTLEQKTITYNDVFVTDTVESLMEKVARSTKIPAENFYLLYHGKIMSRGDASLEDYNYISDHTIEVRLRNSNQQDKVTRSGKKY
jgi:Ubiquitin family/MutS domain I